MRRELLVIDLKDKVSIGDRLAALEAVNAETSMRVSELEIQRLHMALDIEGLEERLEDLELDICPEPMEDDAA